MIYYHLSEGRHRDVSTSLRWGYDPSRKSCNPEEHHPEVSRSTASVKAAHSYARYSCAPLAISMYALVLPVRRLFATSSWLKEAVFSATAP
jgi:hypothetical protein